MVTIKNLVEVFDSLHNKQLVIRTIIPSLDLQVDRTLPANVCDATKIALLLITFGKIGYINTIETLHKQLLVFTDKISEDDPHGMLSWDKEVVLSYDKKRPDGGGCAMYFSIASVEKTEDALKLIAGDEYLMFRVIYDPDDVELE